MPVKVTAAGGSIIDGPAGVEIKLVENTPNGYSHTVETNAKGIAVFEEVPPTKLTAYFDNADDLRVREASETKSIYRMERNKMQVIFRRNQGGFVLDDERGFVVLSTLVEGFIMQQVSDSTPASFVKILIKSATADEKVITTTQTDANGRYQLDSLRPGKYIVVP